MKKMEVRFTWSPTGSLCAGTLTEEEGRVRFEYAPAFLGTRLNLSPVRLPFQAGPFEHDDGQFGPLPGVFDDSLPDGWGLLLMDRHLGRSGVGIEGISPLDLLARVGTRTMGALTYYPPARHQEGAAVPFDLHELARHSRQVLADGEYEVPPQLLQVAEPPGGARPKVLVGVRGRQLISGEGDLPEGFEHWIVKFTARTDPPDAGAVEYAYSLMAARAGVDMPPTRLFETAEGDRFFGVKRFDREGNRRRHVHTFGNLIHANFRSASCDYADLLKVTAALTRNRQDLLRQFRRLVFNVAAHNRDDHIKNFAFVMDDSGVWSVSPAYDLVYAYGPNGSHTMTVAGEAAAPGRPHLLRLAEQAGIARSQAGSIIDEVRAGLACWGELAAAAGVEDTHARQIAAGFPSLSR